MLHTSALACERGGLRLFSGLEFSLPPGGLLRVRGANGSGKTTLLRTLAGLTRPSEPLPIVIRAVIVGPAAAGRTPRQSGIPFARVSQCITFNSS